MSRVGEPLLSSASVEPARGQTSPQEEKYDIKRIEFLGKTRVPILMQSKNGPCPLLAIANQMLLSNRLNLHENQEDISLDSLVHLIAEKLIDENPIVDSDPNSENRRKAVADAIETLPLLSQGLDVNVKFSGVDQFEFDRNTAVFDVLQVNLYHGWVIDLEDQTFGTLRSLTYNSLVERVVMFDSKFGHDENALAAAVANPEMRKVVAEGQLAQHFLHSHASQLTYSGLTSLHEKVRERELGAFFRNNHFSTIFKNEGHLYLLCTDSGFKSRSAVAWERLSDINGDTELCSPSFGDPNAFLSAQEALEDLSIDAALAKQLQLEEDNSAQPQPQPPPPPPPQQQQQQLVNAAQPLAAPLAKPSKPRSGKYNAPPPPAPPGWQTPLVVASGPFTPDEMLARQLQAEEDAEASRIAALNEEKRLQGLLGKKSSSTCSIM